jgi:hypothetical protein
MPYDTANDSGTWHDPRREGTAIKLSKMFGFELCQPDTLQNLIKSVEKLSYM